MALPTIYQALELGAYIGICMYPSMLFFSNDRIMISGKRIAELLPGNYSSNVAILYRALRWEARYNQYEDIDYTPDQRDPRRHCEVPCLVNGAKTIIDQYFCPVSSIWYMGLSDSHQSYDTTS